MVLVSFCIVLVALVLVALIAGSVGFHAGVQKTRTRELARFQKNFIHVMHGTLMEGAKQSFKEGRTCLVIAVPEPFAEEVKGGFMPLYSPDIPNGPLYIHGDAFARMRNVTRPRPASSSKDLN